MIDFYDHPEFVHELMNTIADYNIAQVNEAVAAGASPFTTPPGKK